MFNKLVIVVLLTLSSIQTHIKSNYAQSPSIYDLNDCEYDYECMDTEQCLRPEPTYYNPGIERLIQKQCIQICNFNSDCATNICQQIYT